MKVVERPYTPKRALEAGFILIPFGIGLMYVNVYPSFPLGLFFLGLGMFSFATGFLDWLTRELPWLRNFLKKIAKDIWET